MIAGRTLMTCLVALTMALGLNVGTDHGITSVTSDTSGLTASYSVPTTSGIPTQTEPQDDGVQDQEPAPLPRVDDYRTMVELYRSSTAWIDIPGGGHGTAFAFKREGEYTHLLTAKHCVEPVSWGRSYDADARWIVRYKRKGHDKYEIAELVKKSFLYDLAELRVKNSQMSLLKLEDSGYSPKRSSSNGTYEMVAAIGYPLSVYPAAVSVGYLLGEYHWDNAYYEHSAAAYFGNSGGPLVRFWTGEVIGVTVAGSLKNGTFQSDRILAVKIDQIYEFLSDIEGAEEEGFSGSED